ncbi:hypothetical protein NPA08_00180 [Mycoplasmopsis citelli]|uniref:hypothetical protein n=1 Tax=Mycoplasmopsis citelli TaxID=171281 RepID=UPI002114164B|nr:hypothetical protein [Mycoplasmopsis citelli]UUD36247.1 hypothetical protein NPA08_00180 [Mycoplasmopsis citelli]
MTEQLTRFFEEGTNLKVEQLVKPAKSIFSEIINGAATFVLLTLGIWVFLEGFMLYKKATKARIQAKGEDKKMAKDSQKQSLKLVAGGIILLLAGGSISVIFHSIIP